MKKQALAFLTLFSLILMLSVYYVTLPSDVTSVMSDTVQEEQDADAQVQQTQPEETSAAMQEEIAARMSEKLNEAQAVMADSASGEAGPVCRRRFARGRALFVCARAHPFRPLRPLPCAVTSQMRLQRSILWLKN